MASQQCQHSNRVSGLVKLDFARQDAPDGSTYSGTILAGVCEDCGHIELYAKLHHLLSDWLLKT
jgi:hypothetical protein